MWHNLTGYPINVHLFSFFYYKDDKIEKCVPMPFAIPVISGNAVPEFDVSVILVANAKRPSVGLY